MPREMPGSSKRLDTGRAAGTWAWGRWPVRHGTRRTHARLQPRHSDGVLRTKHPREPPHSPRAHPQPNPRPQRQDIEGSAPGHTGSEDVPELDMAAIATAASTIEAVSTTTLPDRDADGRGATASYVSGMMRARTYFGGLWICFFFAPKKTFPSPH